MLRRFEIYSLRDGAPSDAVAALRRALRDCARFIPEVRDSAVGTNLSDAPLQLAWEHAYDSPAAYQRYMVHPFHAAVLDRWLLSDSPERVVSDNGLGAGLVGYACERAQYRLARGVRRLVLLRVDRAARPEDVHALASLAAAAGSQVPQLLVSIFAANTFASRWFDGVGEIGGPPAWTHVWEQGFASRADLDAYLGGDSEPARTERAGWSGSGDGIVQRALVIAYEIEPGWGYVAG